VEHFNGEWLWLQDEKSGVAGWVQSKFVIPYEQAIDNYTDLIRGNPRAPNYNNRGVIWKAKGEYDRAIADFDEAIRLEPGKATYWNNRGSAWADEKQYDRAIADFDVAIGLAPEDAVAYFNRGNARYRKKEYDRAIADYGEAIRLDPELAAAYGNRGDAWKGKKEYDRVIADYGEAIRLDPKNATPYNGRAWVWATCPDAKHRDGKRAVESSTRACELSGWKDAYHVGTLATSQAEAGDFAKAVEFQEEANALYADPEDKKQGEMRLRLYRDKKPYRATE
jgi:tetratricopeptide (TPR) repeat protein